METDASWAGVTWGDLEARSRPDFASNCRQDWGRSSGNLANHELEEALDLCGESIALLDEDNPSTALDCSELFDLYVPL